MSSAVFASCAGLFLGDNPTAERLANAALGGWVADNPPTPLGAVKLANGDWTYRSRSYDVYRHPGGPLMIRWDNGMTCGESEPRLIRNELRTTFYEPAVIIIRSPRNATLRFGDGTVWRLKKVSDHISTGCE
jgi:hypothetical protein